MIHYHILTSRVTVSLWYLLRFYCICTVCFFETVGILKLRVSESESATNQVGSEDLSLPRRTFPFLCCTTPRSNLGL